MERISKFIYINIEERDDRKKHMLSELEKYGVPSSKIERFNAIVDTNGAKGASNSHMGAVAKYLASPDQEVWAFMEDDTKIVVPKEVLDVFINEFLASEADVFLGTIAHTKHEDFSPNLFRIYSSVSATFYLLKKRAAYSLWASHAESCRRWSSDSYTYNEKVLDRVWHGLMPILIFVTPKIKIMTQIESYSNISKKVINADSVLGKF